MALPNVRNAILPLAKLRDYILDLAHPQGKHKAQALWTGTGLEARHAEWLRVQILEQVPDAPVLDRRVTAFGIGYNVPVRVDGPNGTLTVQTRWIVKEGEHVPRFTTLVPRAPRERGS
jgi:hypothetical protein